MTKVEEYVTKLHLFSSLEETPSDQFYSELDKLWWELTADEQLEVELKLSSYKILNMYDVELKIGDKKPPRIKN
jgi:hypothetical protein